MESEVTIIKLRKALEKSWSADTALGKWTADCPSLNQCAVTSMIVQDYFGGDLLRCECNDGDSHYWNRLTDGTQVDLTSDQFAFSGVVPDKENFIIRQRDYVDSFAKTIKRYNLLSERVKECLRPSRRKT